MRERESRANPRYHLSSRRNAANRTISRGIPTVCVHAVWREYSKTREILRSKALLASAAFLPEGANRFCHSSAGSETAILAVFRVQIDAVLRDFARTCATRMRSHEIH